MASVDKLIEDFINLHRPIPLPPHPNPVEYMEDITGRFLDCSNCDALCCRRSTSALPNGIGDHIGFREDEARTLKERLPYSKWIEFKQKAVLADIEVDGQTQHGLMLPYPCIFLGANNQCSIYTFRPLLCRMFPFEFRELETPKATIAGLSVNYDCPQATNLAKDVYGVWYEDIRELFKGKADT